MAFIVSDQSVLKWKLSFPVVHPAWNEIVSFMFLMILYILYITSSRMGCFILSALFFFLGYLVSSPFALKSPTDTTVSPTDSVLQTH